MKIINGNPVLPPQIVRNYLDRRLQDLEICEAALRDKDPAPLVRIGHQLKGNGTTFGFPELSRIGAELEAAGKSGDLAQAGALVERFQGCLRSAEVPGAAPAGV